MPTSSFAPWVLLALVLAAAVFIAKPPAHRSPHSLPPAAWTLSR
jgi:hypothetical protein